MDVEVALVLFKSKDSTLQRCPARLVAFSVNDSGMLTNPRSPDMVTMTQIHDATTINESLQFCGPVDHRVMAMSARKLLFHCPSCPRIIRVGEEHFRVQLPPVVLGYLFNGQTGSHDLMMWFCSHNSYDNSLWKVKCLVPAQFPNVSIQGRVCLGTVMMHEGIEPDPLKMIDLIEKHHYGGEFTEWRGDQTIRLFKKMGQWADKENGSDLAVRYIKNSKEQWKISPMEAFGRF